MLGQDKQDRLEVFSLVALHALLSNSAFNRMKIPEEHAAKYSVEYATALAKALDEQAKGK